MWLVLALALAAEDEPSMAILPLQGDLSFGFGLGERPLLTGNLFVGGALGWARQDRPSLFGALGFEATYNGSERPYRTGLGAQIRVGLVWARPQGHATTALPELLVFLRATPFWAGLATQVRTPMGTVTSSTTFFGFRAGLGATAVWLSRLYFDNVPFVDRPGFLGELLKVAASIGLLPVLLLNHFEVAFEYAMSPVPLRALVFRLGSGF